MEEEKKKTTFLFVFLTYLPVFLLKFRSGELVGGSSNKDIASLKDAMDHAFSMTDLGLLSQFLGLKIAQSQHGIKVHQSKYALDFLNKFNMKYSKTRKNPFLSGVKLEEAGSYPMIDSTLYRQVTGCLLYLTHT